MKRKYVKRETKVALRLILWIALELFRMLFNLGPYKLFGKVRKPSKDGDLRLAILSSGGIGDILMYSLTIKELSRHIGCDHTIDIVYGGGSTGVSFIFNGFPFIKNIFTGIHTISGCSTNSVYDAVIKIDRGTTIAHCNYDTVGRKSPWLREFCEKHDAFFREHWNLFRCTPQYHCVFDQWSIVNGKTRQQQPDTCQILGINYDTHTFLKIETPALEVLKTFGLHGTRYATIQRGAGYREKSHNNVRTWPVKHYEKFIELFHKQHKDIRLVQLGSSHATSVSIAGIDLNLVDKTSKEELTVILKHSLFHLDGECGMVHMKKFLGGRSIVLFGPTSLALLAYEGNINIVGPGCSSWCEWITKDWSERCPRGFDEAPCMTSITAECVMEGANKLIEGQRNYIYHAVKCPPREDAIADFIAENCANRDAAIVDILNANGWSLASQLRANFANVTMFRLDHKFDSFSSAKNLGLGLEYGCIYNISMGDDSCDVVVWQNDDPTVNHEYALMELFRILKPNGLLILSGITTDGATAKKFGLEKILPGVNAFTKETADS